MALRTNFPIKVRKWSCSGDMHRVYTKELFSDSILWPESHLKQIPVKTGNTVLTAKKQASSIMYLGLFAFYASNKTQQIYRESANLFIGLKI